MALPNVLAFVRASAVILCLGPVLAPGAKADDAKPAVPVVMAQADPDAPPEDSQAGGTAALLVRIERLEDRLRGLTGQVEQLQFQNKKLDDQLRKMQQDVDFRFQDLGRSPGVGTRPLPLKKSDSGEVAPGAPIVAEAGAVAAPAITAESPRPAKRTGDAFDPASNPDAPGAPKPLGTTVPSQPPPTGAIADAGSVAVPAPSIATAPHAPLDLTPNGLTAPAHGAASTIEEAAIVPDTTPHGAPATGARGEYDSAMTVFKGAQYDAAIEGFQGFLEKYPKDKLVPDATYYLGESFARQGRQREAAEQFLKLSTDYTKSSRAPDALLRLGVALNALGAKEQACATYEQVDRRYPTASSDVRASVERELKRAKC